MISAIFKDILITLVCLNIITQRERIIIFHKETAIKLNLNEYNNLFKNSVFDTITSINNPLKDVEYHSKIRTLPLRHVQKKYQQYPVQTNEVYLVAHRATLLV